MAEVPAASAPQAPNADPGSPHTSHVDWGHPRRTLFRFGSIYFLLYFFPFPLTAFAGIAGLDFLPMFIRTPGIWCSQAAGWYEQGVQTTVVWFGGHILRLPSDSIVIQLTGSGDTMLNYVQSACFVVLALAGALAWSVADRKRPAYPRLAEFLRIYLRYALAAVMLGYGLAKLPPMQFSPPGPDRLMRTFGQSSPMGLLWTFMGFSPVYTMFAGFMEALGAVLLLWRRTATLGAIVLTGVLINVVMLNFCYDVPVKLYSLHLLAAALVLLLPAWPRLLGVLILNRATAPAVLWRPFDARWKNRTLRAAKAAFVILMFGTGIYGAYRGWQVRGFTRPKPPLYGLYEVESFDRDGQSRPPLTTDAFRWRRLVFTQYGSAYIQDMSDKMDRYIATYDAAAGSLKLQTPGAGAQDFTFACAMPGEDELVLDGSFRGGRLHITLKKVPESASTLTARGFHWVQELPFNR